MKIDPFLPSGGGINWPNVLKVAHQGVPLGEDSLQCASLEIESHAVLSAGTDGTFTPFKVL